MASKYGPMVPDMRANGELIRPMVKASYTMLMAMYTKASGSMIRLKGLVVILMPTEHTTKENGSMTNNTVTAWNLGPMVLATTEYM